MDFNSRLIRPTGISGLAGGGISPGSRFFMLNNDLLISLSFEGPEINFEKSISYLENRFYPILELFIFIYIPCMKGCKYSAISAPPFSAFDFNFSVGEKKQNIYKIGIVLLYLLLTVFIFWFHGIFVVRQTQWKLVISYLGILLTYCGQLLTFFVNKFFRFAKSKATRVVTKIFFEQKGHSCTTHGHGKNKRPL